MSDGKSNSGSLFVEYLKLVPALTTTVAAILIAVLYFPTFDSLLKSGSI
jgi:hypothetical protein